MTKRKNFRDWYNEEDEWGDKEPKYTKKDGKRYDKKKAKIQKARKQKARQKNSFFN
jgi:hypothetical protein